MQLRLFLLSSILLPLAACAPEEQGGSSSADRNKAPAAASEFSASEHAAGPSEAAPEPEGQGFD